MAPRLTRLAQSLPQTVPFVGVETQERASGRPFRARLGGNENGFGASPRVAEAMTLAAGEMWKYGDSESHDLRQALAARNGISAENIAVGEGIDGLLGLVVRLFAEPGSIVVSSLGAYPTFNYHVAGFGAHLHVVPYRDDREDLEALLQAARTLQPAILYLANPDNPMGSWWPADEVAAFMEALPEDVLLVLDEAYGEFAPPSVLPALHPIRPNVLRMRTFSKAYGLAGMRCGYAIGAPEVIRAFDKVRNHFGVSHMTQVAALAALGDDAFLKDVVLQLQACRQELVTISRDNGLVALPSATNFVAIDCGSDGAFATRVLRNLAEQQIFIRKPMAPVLDRCIRVSCGPEGEIALFAEALPRALAAASSAAK
ncbi:MAG TPA: pyridoxal phosphate-dependent aminotransferase [Tianweitania sediminis]|jgi:histidinol-phosphate aminotransferase|nr:pyridoxal phosphate-dependent aminotransferase [Tianweitania sediminis]